MSIGSPVPTTPIVDSKGWMNNNFRTWTQQTTREVNKLEILSGTGSPEGVVTADPTRQYMDDAGIAGAVTYIKQTGSGNTGWVLT